jgi:protein-tyrosine-phosphatase
MEDHRILFVCSGNTCRSPMAAALCRKWLEFGAKWDVQSAGVGALKGQPPSRLAVEVLRGKGIDLTGHRSQPLTGELIDRARLIVVMTRSQRGSILARWPKAESKIFLLSSFGTHCRQEDISDPMGGDESDYRGVYEKMEAVMPDLVLALERQFGAAQRQRGRKCS